MDQQSFIRGLERDDLFTVVHDQVLTDTAMYADVVLPATTHFEAADLVLIENGEPAEIRMLAAALLSGRRVGGLGRIVQQPQRAHRFTDEVRKPVARQVE